MVRRDDGIAGAINVNHRPCSGMQGAKMPHGDNAHDLAMTGGEFLRYALVRGTAVQVGL